MPGMPQRNSRGHGTRGRSAEGRARLAPALACRMLATSLTFVERCSERVENHLHVCADDTGDIDPQRPRARTICARELAHKFAQKVMGSASHHELFALADRLRRRAVRVGRARLHLAHHDESTLARDDVEFTVTYSPVARDNLVAVSLVPPRDEIFAPRAARTRC